MLDAEVCYRALRARDERFDGRIFVGVKTTGIYCRPVCPARQPRFDNCQFFASAAAAQEEGFRPCLRCRPETVVDLGPWRGTSNTVSRGLALIAEGELDGEEAGIEELAEKLGVGGRQLRRLFRQHLGASPIAVAQTRRVLFAKQLLHETRLPMAEVALAAGFGSVRRFNEVFHGLFGRAPGALRRESGGAESRGGQSREGESGAAAGEVSAVTVRLKYRAPYDWGAALGFLRARAIEGVEVVDGERYERTVALGGHAGRVAVEHVPEKGCFAVTIRFPDVRQLGGIVTRVRRVLDLEADVGVIGGCLSGDPMLAGLVAARPGLRVPGGWDGFELAARAVLGQQVTVEAARRLAGALARLCGGRVAFEGEGESRLAFTFPTAEQVAGADLAGLGMPGARKEALRAIARAAVAEPGLFRARGSVEETVGRLSAIPGVGEWTAQYVALRGAREPDAFPASDVALLRAAGRLLGEAPSPRELLARAERWRPWRGYAAQHLWAADAAGERGRAAG